ncbi:hypothetical protein NQ318_004764 [Aromia moschata]|uniref:Uncharacterized protein n=1 Tax=Aromia moschata TaxID=1265417 RepID=A0AAV8XW98_9CUCU|nr:hypothetical protein NQ318_004764 [Aromia moschata]
MKSYIVLASMVFMVSAVSQKEAWEKYKVDYGKNFASGEEEEKRYGIFLENLRIIEEHNAEYEKGKVSYRAGINQFTDMTHEEFVGTLRYDSSAFKRNNKDKTVLESFYGVHAPDEIDWRTKGAVTRVKDQQSCGGCWAFSATGALEGQNFIKNGKLIDLSPQELIDCDDQSNGCEGGDARTAYGFAKLNGIESWDDYPFENKHGTCRRTKRKTVLRIKGFAEVVVSEEALKAAVATIGPISVGIDATDFDKYEGHGVHQGQQCSNDPSYINHAVLVVGYGTQDGNDYWLIKNSWGPGWEKMVTSSWQEMRTTHAE